MLQGLKDGLDPVVRQVLQGRLGLLGLRVLLVLKGGQDRLDMQVRVDPKEAKELRDILALLVHLEVQDCKDRKVIRDHQAPKE